MRSLISYSRLLNFSSHLYLLSTTVHSLQYRLHGTHSQRKIAMHSYIFSHENPMHLYLLIL